MTSINSLDDEVQLQKMLNATNDPDERKLIRTRLLEVKKIKSEQREKERVDREQRRDDDVKRRSQAQVEENLQRMKVFDETAKSFGAKQESQVDKLKEQALKDKHAFIEKERKAELARIEAAAKERSAADRGESRNELLTKERQQRIADDKKIQEKNLKEMSKYTSSTTPK